MKKLIAALVVLLSFHVALLHATPDWFMAEQKDSVAAYYGVGEGETQELAIKAALNEIASKIAVTVESNFKNEQTVSNSEFSKTTESKIASNVKKMSFNNYQVTKKAADKDSYFVLVKVDRQLLFEEKLSELDTAYSKLQSEYSEISKATELEKFRKLLVLEGELKNLNEKMYLIKSVSPDFDYSKYQKIYTDFQTAFIKTKALLSVNIVSENEVAKNYSKVFAKKLSEKGIKIGSSKPSGILYLKASAKEKKVQSTNEDISNASFASVELALTLKDSTNTEIASNIVRFVNNSTLSYSDALKKTLRLERYLSENLIYNVVFSIEAKTEEAKE